MKQKTIIIFLVCTLLITTISTIAIADDTPIIMTGEELQNDSVIEGYGTDSMTISLNSLDDGDTLIIKDRISNLIYEPDYDTTKILLGPIKLRFEGDLTMEGVDDYTDFTIEVQVHIKHVTFDVDSVHFDVELFEEQWQHPDFLTSPGFNPPMPISTILKLVFDPDVPVPPNSPPTTPRVFGPAVCFVGESYEYSAKAVDIDGDELHYVFTWTSIDGTTESSDTHSGTVPSGTPVTVNHIWSTPGTYEVRALVTDSANHISDFSEPLQVRVSTEPTTEVVADAGGPYYGRVGDTIYFDNSGSTGPIAEYQWDFGQGFVIAPNGQYGPDESTYVYDRPGDYTVTLKVIDCNGHFDTDTCVVYILSDEDYLNTTTDPYNETEPNTPNQNNGFDENMTRISDIQINSTTINTGEEFTIIILDNMSRPVKNAKVIFNNKLYEADDDGVVLLQAPHTNDTINLTIETGKNVIEYIRVIGASVPETHMTTPGFSFIIGILTICGFVLIIKKRRY